ncbi:MAG TPA: TerC/Alx family metal homeostasis membrane protein [Nitrososphaeraceae archaeon]|nr:TerC/Alx family metal homeostasis membrane protein [Nitrososphaeraceae archaeon]
MDSIPVADSNADYLVIWVFFTLFVGVALAIDFGIICKIQYIFRMRNGSRSSANNTYQQRATSSVLSVEPKSPQQQQVLKRAFVWTIIWKSLAMIFAAIIYFALGYEKTLLFVTGYAIEKSLSVDNMFVFLLIFSSLAIPHIYQHKVLMAGILSAIIMRVGLILAGVSLLESFHWMIYIFGGLLLFTAIRMLIQKKNEHGEKTEMTIEKNIAVRIMKKFVPITFELDNDKFLLRKSNNNGHKLLYATPMLVALVIVEMTDLVFALDSIPAILAITTDSFIVITSNIFAILGLRSLYFLLAGMMEKFYYLKPGLAMILFFVGSKMLVSEYFEIPLVISLMVIFGILASALVLSFIRTRQQQANMVIDK